MKRPPTDFELLRAIWIRHRDEYEKYVDDVGDRATKILVPIDIPAIAGELQVDPHSVFGRLYYHLEPIHGEKKSETTGARKVFFTPVAGDDANCVNFPLLEAVLASLWQEHNCAQRTFWIAVGSLCIALVSLGVAIITAVST